METQWRLRPVSMKLILDTELKLGHSISQLADIQSSPLKRFVTSPFPLNLSKLMAISSAEHSALKRTIGSSPSMVVFFIHVPEDWLRAWRTLLPSFPLGPRDSHALFCCWLFPPSLWNTPPRLLAQSPLQPKSPASKAEVDPGKIWV